MKLRFGSPEVNIVFCASILTLRMEGIPLHHPSTHRSAFQSLRLNGTLGRERTQRWSLLIQPATNFEASVDSADLMRHGAQVNSRFNCR